MRVALVIITYNISAEIMLLQVSAIKKLCKDEDFTIIIVDNSSDTDKAQDLCYHSRLLGITYHKTFSSSINSSDSHSFSANLSYQKLKDHFDIMAYFDHDLIPMREFSVMETLGDNVIVGLGQGAKKKYFWPGCVMFDNTKIDHNIVDFSPNNEFGLDTGGNFYRIIEEYGEDKCIFFNETYHQNPHFISTQYGHYAMINDGMFMHFIASSNWVGLEDNENRINSLLNIAREKLNSGQKENTNIYEG